MEHNPVGGEAITHLLILGLHSCSCCPEAKFWSHFSVRINEQGIVVDSWFRFQQSLPMYLVSPICFCLRCSCVLWKPWNIWPWTPGQNEVASSYSVVVMEWPLELWLQNMDPAGIHQMCSILRSPLWAGHLSGSQWDSASSLCLVQLSLSICRELVTGSPCRYQNSQMFKSLCKGV